MSVHDEDYSRNALSALNLISTFFIITSCMTKLQRHLANISSSYGLTPLNVDWITCCYFDQEYNIFMATFNNVSCSCFSMMWISMTKIPNMILPINMQDILNVNMVYTTKQSS